MKYIFSVFVIRIRKGCFILSALAFLCFGGSGRLAFDAG